MIAYPPSPDAFADECRRIVIHQRGHAAHRSLDLLTNEILRSLGFGEGVDVFEAAVLNWHREQHPYPYIGPCPNCEETPMTDLQALSPWQSCRIGSCHRHQDCMYSPCRASSAPESPWRPISEALAKGGLALGPNGFGGSKIAIDFDAPSDARRLFELLSDLPTPPAGEEG